MDWVYSYISGVAHTLRSDGGREAWPRITGFFDAEFVEAVNREIAADTTTHLQLMLD